MLALAARTPLNAAQTLTAPQDATHLCIQVLEQQVNVRIVVDGQTAAQVAHGFRLTANDEPAIFPVISTAGTVSICPEAAGADVQYQWFRRWRAGGG